MRIAALLIGLVLTAPAAAQTAAPQPASPGGFAAPPRADAPAPAANGPAAHTEAVVAKTVKTSRDLFIGSYITVDKACKVGKQPTVDFTQQPANGAVRKRRDAFNLAHAPGVPRNKCLGVSPDGIAVMYVSKPRFKGEDSFAYTVNFGDGRTRSVKATVTVQ